MKVVNNVNIAQMNGKFYFWMTVSSNRSHFSDLILASLIDGSRASSNYQIFVMSRNFEKNLRISPFKYLLDEDGESQLMKHIINVPRKLSYIMLRGYLIRFFFKRV